MGEAFEEGQRIVSAAINLAYLAEFAPTPNQASQRCDHQVQCYVVKQCWQRISYPACRFSLILSTVADDQASPMPSVWHAADIPGVNPAQRNCRAALAVAPSRWMDIFIRHGMPMPS
jgi:hypothetical protein